MQAKFDSKTNTVSIEGMTVNPKATELSESKRSIPLGYDRIKISIDGREAVVAVNVYAPTDKKSRK